MAEAFSGAEKHFDSLDECLDEIAKKVYGVTFDQLSDTQAGDPCTYLFRGESRYFPDTKPGTLRLLEDGVSFRIKSMLIDIEDRFLEEYEEEFGDDAIGFLQHYHIPTDLIDFTSSLKVAAYFACEADLHEPGLIGVLNLSKARKKCTILNLTGSKIANRARRQQAYAIRHYAGDFKDLKEQVCRDAIGLTWYSFEKKWRDADLFKDMKSIIYSSGDKCAQRMIQIINECRRSAWQSSREVDLMLDKIIAKLS